MSTIDDIPIQNPIIFLTINMTLEMILQNNLRSVVQLVGSVQIDISPSNIFPTYGFVRKFIKRVRLFVPL